VIPHAGPGRRTVWLLPLVVAFYPALHAQVPDSPVVPAETVVVEGKPLNSDSVQVTRVPIDNDRPALASSWAQLSPLVPNLAFESAGPSSFGAIYSLRGLSNTPYFSDPAVTVYFDDIPLGGSFSYPTDLFAFSSVSVFRGPQATAFGRAGDGGVIVLSPFDSQGLGEFRIGVGDYDARSASLLAGTQGGTTADATVAASFTEREGFIENTQIGKRVDDLRAANAFVRQRYRPTAESELSLEMLGDRHRDGAAPLVPLGGPLYTVARSQEGVSDSDFFGAALKGALNTGAGRFTSDSSYTNWKLDPYDDWLVLPPPLRSDLTQAQEDWNEELRFVSNPGTAVSWCAGAWASEGTTTGASNRSIDGLVPIEVSGYGYTKHEAALFGELVLQPAPAWRIALGARAEATGKVYHQEEQVPTSGLRLNLSRTDRDFLPRCDVSHDFSGAISGEASVSLGSRPGGFAAYTDNPSLIPFAPEHTLAFEAGLKGLFEDKTLTLSARAFEYEISNYQIERSFSPTDYFVATAPRARSMGAELEAAWNPAPAWTVGADGGLTDVTLLEFRDPLNGTSYDGNRAPYAPAFTLGLSVTYRSARGWFATANASAVGKTFYTESEDATYAQAAFALLGARAGFDARRWRITVHVENASGKGYYTLIVPGVGSAAPGPPRTIGTELTAKF
jgi:iron complex outermembrane recepter protein